MVFGRKDELQEYMDVFETHVRLMVQLEVRIYGCQVGILSGLVRHAIADLGTIATDVGVMRADVGAMRTDVGTKFGLVLRDRSRISQEVITELTRVRSGSVDQRLTLLASTDITAGLRWKKEILMSHLRNLEVSKDAVQWHHEPRRAEEEQRSAATLTRRGQSQKVQGFVEWKSWNIRSHDAEDVSQVGQQIGALSYVLSDADNTRPPEAARVPECRAFFLDDEQDRYGVFFSVRDVHQVDCASSDMSLPSELRSLRGFMTDSRIHEPDRAWKLRTAREVATALYTLHTWGVCQKAVSSKNILFFPSADDSSHQSAAATAPPDQFGRGPYLAGFAIDSEHARMSATDLTYYPLDYLDRRLNQPKVSDNAFFWPEYDLLGLGLTLLEVALWQPMEHYYGEWSCRNEFQFLRIHCGQVL
jgi:hypothetical protein